MDEKDSVLATLKGPKSLVFAVLRVYPWKSFWYVSEKDLSGLVLSEFSFAE